MSKRQRRTSVSILAPLLLVFSSAGVWPDDVFVVPADPPGASYTVEAELDLESGSLTGRAVVDLTNTSRITLPALAFPGRLGGVSFQRVFLDGVELQPLEKSANPLVYLLPDPLNPGERVVLEVEFRLGGVASAEDERIALQNWCPRLWWNDLAVHESFKVKLSAPEGYAMAVSGRLDPESGYYLGEGIATLGLFLQRGARTATREVGDVLITALFKEDGERCAGVCLDTAADVIGFYKGWLGFYPYKFLYIVPWAPQPWGGFPFATGIVAIHGHQYWGENVLDDDDPAWLWIGMGIYADREYVLARGLPLDKHRGLIERYLEGIRDHHDLTMDITPEKQRKINFDFNNEVIHGKGFAVISALEDVLGREEFQRIYRKCAGEYGGRRLGYREFRRICEAESGRDLKWFFEQWVRSNLHLYYTVESTSTTAVGDGKYVSQVTVARKGNMRMPVPVKAVFADGSSRVKRVNLLASEDCLIFESAAPLKEVLIDPDHHYAMLGEPLSLTKEIVLDQIGSLPWEGAEEEKLVVFTNAKAAGIDDSRSWYRLGIMLFGGGYYDEGIESWSNVLELDKDEFTQFTAHTWIGLLEDVKGNREAALESYRHALESYDGDRQVRHDQYGLKINRGWVEERLKNPFKWGK